MIVEIFRQSDVEYGEESIEALIMDQDFGRVAFMTESWILKFDLRLFVGVVPKRGDPRTDRRIGLTQQKNLPNELYSRHRNCLFNPCMRPE